MKAINPYESSNREIGRIFVLFGRNFKQIEGYFRKTDRVQNGSTIDLTSIQSHSVMLLVSCVLVKHKQIIIRQVCRKMHFPVRVLMRASAIARLSQEGMQLVEQQIRIQRTTCYVSEDNAKLVKFCIIQDRDGILKNIFEELHEPHHES